MAAKSRIQTGQWAQQALIWLMVGLLTLFMIALLSWPLSSGNQLRLEVGQIAPTDMRAPRQISYESQVLTERARERAAQAVPGQYDGPEGRVRRQQVDRSREILVFITTVRNDSYASPELRTDYLQAISELVLSQETILQILSMTNEEWAIVANEVPLALGRVMREEIRDTTVAVMRRRVPTLIDSNLDDNTSSIVASLIRDLVLPNSFLNEERTEVMRDEARAQVPMQLVSYQQGEIILRAGEKARAEHVEALEQVGLLRVEWSWWVVARAAFFTLTLVAVIILALQRVHAETTQSTQKLALICLATTLWLVGAKFMIRPHDWLPYLYPLATLGMLLAVLVDVRVAVIFSIAFTVTIAYLDSSGTALVVYMGLGSLFGSLLLGRAERLMSFLWAGLAVAVSNLLVFAAFRAPFTEFTTPELVQLLLVLSLNGGIAASIAFIGYYALGNIFGITTSLQLTELSRPTHPLLRQLLLKAPGTYHHTIVVSNLAERAAAAIGADAFLARVGAYYHDIGKTVRPYFFSENNADGAPSPHEKLDPYTSAQIIISHISDGVDLAHKYRLPVRIQDFIREHHGRSTTQYFYIQAQNEAQEGEVINAEDFRYAGPNPRSKETAILLLADTCEAAIRAIRPSTREELAALVNRLIEQRMTDGELDDCHLTFKELQIIKGIFVQVLQGVHHPRVAYPEPVIRRPGEAPILVMPPEPRTETGLIAVPTNGRPSMAHDVKKTAAVPGGIEQPA